MLLKVLLIIVFMAWAVLLFRQNNNKNIFRTKFKLMNKHNGSLALGLKKTFDFKSTALPDIPNWVPKLSSTFENSSIIPAQRLQAIFSDAKFFSFPIVSFNSTVIQNITLELKRDRVDPKLIVPNIVHLVWFYYPKPEHFRFHHAMCLLSIRKFIKPDKILFWYDIEPTGKWWDYIRGLMSDILMVRRQAPSKIFKNLIKVPQHKSDVARLEALIAFGGIYLDLDVIVLKSFKPLRKHNVTFGKENHQTVGNSIIVAVPNSTFLWLMYYSYYSFNDRIWAYNSCILPMKLSKLYPDIVHVEEKSILRPNWRETNFIFKKGMLWNWKYNYCIHLYIRCCKSSLNHNLESIKQLNTTMGEIFRYIYYGNSSMIKDK